MPELPLILILSVYTDFFTLRFWQNTDTDFVLDQSGRSGVRFMHDV